MYRDKHDPMIVIRETPFQTKKMILISFLCTVKVQLMQSFSLPFRLDSRLPERGFRLLFVVRGTSSIDPVGKLPFTFCRRWWSLKN